jgi:hypothetical protein
MQITFFCAQGSIRFDSLIIHFLQSYKLMYVNDVVMSKNRLCFYKQTNLRATLTVALIIGSVERCFVIDQRLLFRFFVGK